MNYIIIILLSINLVLGIIALFKNINESNITERLGKLELSMMKEMGEFKTDLKNPTEEQLIKIFNEKFFKTIMKIEKDNFGAL